ncbi:MAG: beta-propeller fold lactonase family protein [Deltaproteobacteria bacterium]|nr:beta-propeller fold lactonase family protein [Deltaproteobacteria bacterium]
MEFSVGADVDRKAIAAVEFYLDEILGNPPLFTTANATPTNGAYNNILYSITTVDVDSDGYLEQLFQIPQNVFQYATTFLFAISGKPLAQAFQVVGRAKSQTGVILAQGASGPVNFSDRVERATVSLGCVSSCDGGTDAGVDAGADAGAGTDAGVMADAGADADAGVVTDAGAGADASVGPPDPPSDLSARPGNRRTTLTWDASIGATSYVVSQKIESDGGVDAGSLYAALGSTSNPIWIQSGLSNGATATFIVRAQNDAGQSDASAEIAARPYAEICVLNNIANHIVALDATRDAGPALRLFGNATGIVQPYGVAVDLVNNEIIVANSYMDVASEGPGLHSIVVHSLAASGNVAPVRTIAGPTTTLSRPFGLAVDVINNEIFVANYSGSSILVFPRDAGGDIAPTRVISGAATGLSAPHAVVVDTTGNEIFVLNWGLNSVTSYARTANGNVAPTRTIVGPDSGISLARGLALDVTANELFVTNKTTSDITVYNRTANGDVAPKRVIDGGTSVVDGGGAFQPFGIAFSSTYGEIVTTNADSSIRAFLKSASGKAAPTWTISGGATLLDFPTGIAVSDGGEFVVASLNNNTVLTHSRSAPGAVAPVRSISPVSSGLAISGRLIAVDTVNDEIFVSSLFAGTIVVLSRSADGGVVPLRTLGGATTQITQPNAVAVDNVNNEIIVTDEYDDQLHVFARTAAGNVAPQRTISGASTGLANPSGVAVDPGDAGEIYVTNSQDNSVTVYDRLGSGNLVYKRRIQGAATLLSSPYGIALDGVNNELVVVNYLGNSITAFGRNANGNVAPTRAISGTSTRLYNPTAVIVDSVDNEIFVTSIARDEIQVFSRTATGDVAPRRTIRGPSTQLAYPYGMAFCN